MPFWISITTTAKKKIMQAVTGKSMNVTSRILTFTIIEYKQEAKGSTLAISQDINELSDWR